jgi:serine/threonine protein kinase/tetratricopeptide (TPR) repeat protein
MTGDLCYLIERCGGMPKLIDNRFECLEEIGRGTDSIVYRGIDHQTGATVAIKTIPAVPSRGFSDLEREISARLKCRSSFVLPIVAWGNVDDKTGKRVYSVSPFLEGETLRSRLKGSKGALPEDETVSLALELCKALETVHQSGLFHSDLKPENIFFTTDGRVVLLDFGLARGFQPEGAAGGTPTYASPEQLMEQSCDGRSDLYALGCILYETATGAPPFVSNDVAEVLFDHVNTVPAPPSHHNPALSPFLSAVIVTLMEKSPERRFQSATELGQTLFSGESSAWWSSRLISDAGRPSMESEISHWRPSKPLLFPLVGRKTEFERLNQHLNAAVQSGIGSFVVVSGPAGVGKTRLMEEALSRIEGTAFILGSRCIRFDTRIPYLPLIDLIDDLIRRARYDSARFQRFLTRHLDRTPLLVPRFMEFLSKQPVTGSGPGALTTDNLLYLFTALFQHMATEFPLVLFIDDLHWAEPSTCNFLRYFVRNIGNVPLAVLGGYRPEELTGTGESEPPAAGMLRDLATEPNFETVNLTTLSARESQELVAEVCGTSVGKELGGMLFRKTEGNPYYLFESVSLLRERQVIIGDGASSRVASSVSEISIPSTVADLMKSRISRLKEPDRELLDFASIVGPAFTTSFLMFGSGEDELSLLRRLARIEREHGIIRSRESGYAFDHHLLHEFIYQSIAPDLRSAYHRQVAEKLEASGGDLTGEVVYTLADHFSKGSHHAKASEYLLKAARQSMAKYSGIEALEALRGARAHYAALSPREKTRQMEWDIARLQAEIASHLGDSSLEGQAVGEMERLAELEHSDLWSLEAAEQRAELALRTSSFDQALKGFALARTLASQLNDKPRLAKIAHRTGTAYREMLRWDEAMTHFKEALELAESQGDSHLVGQLLKDIGTVKTKQAMWVEATEDYTRALPLLREAGDRREEASALNGLAVSLFCAGNEQAALERWDEANKIFESIGYPSGQSNILHNLGVTYSNLGQIDRAIECLDSALQLRQAIGMRHAQVSTLTRIAFVYLIIGAWDRAAEHLRMSLGIARKIQADLPSIETYYHFIELALAQGDLDAARKHMIQAWQTLGDAGDSYHRAHLDLAEAMISLAGHDPGSALVSLDRAGAEDLRDPQLSAEISVNRAWALQLLGKTEEADKSIQRYQELSRGCPFIYARINGSVVLREIYRLRSDKAAEAAETENIRAELLKIDAGISNPELRTAFLARWGEYLTKEV